MTFPQIFLLALLIGVFVLFVWGRWRYDVIALGALIVATVVGIVPAEGAFSGFGHPATVTVAIVLVLSRGLQNSGAVDIIARNLLPPLARPSAHVGALAGVGAGLSAIMNNVGALALLMPAALRSAAKAERSPSLILMPLSFGAILGGLVTLIGTPPNIIVAAYRGEVTGTPFGMFDFSPVGGAVALAGVAFVSLVGWRLIPKARRVKPAEAALFDIDAYVGEAKVPADTVGVGKTLSELDDLAAEHEALILGLVRGERQLNIARRDEIVRADDVVIIEAGPEAMAAAMAALGLRPADAGSDSTITGTADGGKRRSALKTGDVILAEAVVPPRSRLIGQVRGTLHLRRRFGVNILAVSRQGQAFRGRLKTFRFAAGDVLLLQGEAERVPEAITAIGCLPLAERGLQVGKPHMAGLSLGVLAVAVAAASFGLLSLPVALATAVLAMVLTGIVAPREIYDSIDWPVVILLGAMIPVGRALSDTGTTTVLAQALVDVSMGMPPAVIVGLLMVVTMTLSDIMNNAATAVVMAPIGVGMADRLSVSPDPFLMAVAIGASCAFLTPIGHQNNTLILGPGGYRFGDYWRMGLPLEILIVAVALPLLIWVWPLTPVG
ncbi:MAG: SLC13 family permease [Inquilinaceae bacterium]